MGKKQTPQQAMLKELYSLIPLIIPVRMLLTLAMLLWAGIIFSQGVQLNGVNVIVKSGGIFSVNGNFVVNENAALNIGAGSKLLIGDDKNLTINNGGLIRITGSETDQTMVSSPGYFFFLVNAGGTIGADYATFEKMNGNGLTIMLDANIDPALPLNYSIFQSGAPESTLLTINNDQVLTIDGVTFFATGLENYNAAKTLSTGEITFSDYTGSFAGEVFENDPFGLIQWGTDVPSNRLVQNVTAMFPEELCFDASQTITVTNLTVISGASVNLIAGVNILILPGVLVESGGNFHAWISTNGLYCADVSMLASVDAGETLLPPVGKANQDKSSLRAFPNPTTGIITLEVPVADNISTITIEMYDMLGNCLIRAGMPASANYTLDLTGRQPGMYIVRILHGSYTDFVKIIKQ